jgi:hypothetical protein
MTVFHCFDVEGCQNLNLHELPENPAECEIGVMKETLQLHERLWMFSTPFHPI